MQTKAASKEGLRQAIIAKRHARGDGDIKMDLREPEKMDVLTPQEKVKRERRKEQNRRAAQRCRFKKRQTQNKVLQTFQSILDSNKDLQDEMLILKLEKDQLQMAWNNHRSNCPLFSSTTLDPSCSIKMETPCAMDGVMPVIKQEPPPLSDCMAMSNASLSTGLTPSGIESQNMKPLYPYAGCYYPYKDNYCSLDPYQQQNYPQHQQSSQIIPSSWPMANSFHLPSSQLVGGSLSENINPNTPSPISPNSKTTMHQSPLPMREEHHHKMAPQPQRYDTQESKMPVKNILYQNGHVNLPQQNQLYKKDHLTNKLQSQVANNITTSPVSTSTPTSTASPTPKLVSKYPDLCRKLQRTPTPHVTPSSPDSNTIGARTVSPVKSEISASACSQLSKPPQLKRLLHQGANMIHTQNDNNRLSSSPKNDNVKIPLSSIMSINTPLNASSASCSLENPLTPSSCLYAVPSCMNNNDTFFTDVQRPSDAGSVTDSVLTTIHQELPSSMDTSDIDPDNIFNTALDMENSYNNLPCENGLSSYNGNQEGMRSSIGISECSGLNPEENSTYSMSTSTELTSSVIVDNSARGQGQNGNFIGSPMTDDLSNIPSKELLFFRKREASNFPAISANHFLEQQ